MSRNWSTRATARVVSRSWSRCMTDNRNRTVAEVRHAFSKHGGNLGTDGSVAYLFTSRASSASRRGDEEAIMDVGLDAGVEDIDVEDDGALSLTTPWENLSDVVEALTAVEHTPDHAEVTMVASTMVDCDVDTAAKVLRLIDVLEELDDVQRGLQQRRVSHGSL